MLCSSAARVQLSAPAQLFRRPCSGKRRHISLITAVWAWEQQPQQDCEPERFSSLFALPEVPPSNNPLHVFDARDALEACSGLNGEDRQECLVVFGVDAERVDAFYSTVYKLEMALEMDTDPEEEASHRGAERC